MTDVKHTGWITGGDISLLVNPKCVDRIGYTDIRQTVYEDDQMEFQLSYGGGGVRSFTHEPDEVMRGYDIGYTRGLLSEALEEHRLFIAHANLVYPDEPVWENFQPYDRMVGFGDVYELKVNAELQNGAFKLTDKPPNVLNLPS